MCPCTITQRDKHILFQFTSLASLQEKFLDYLQYAYFNFIYAGKLLWHLWSAFMLSPVYNKSKNKNVLLS